MPVFYIGEHQLNINLISDIILGEYAIGLSEQAKERINNCRSYLDDKIKRNNDPVYGINTGFGYLQNVKVAEENLTKLQHNLLLSHACGTGEEVSKEIVKLMLLLKIQSLSYGFSAISLKTVQRLIDFYTHDILPVVYTQGSLGASGDLAPLAHLALPLIGEGEVMYQDNKIKTVDLYKKLNWEPLALQSKEGLALINGT